MNASAWHTTSNALACAVHGYQRWQERWRDPILTTLLVLLSLEVFVNIPALTRSHFSGAPAFAAVSFLPIVAAAVIATRHRVAIAAILLSSILTLVANTLRLEAPSTWTVCLGSGSLFGPGRVTHHRIQGAVVLYLCVALLFAALYQILLALMPGSISSIAGHGNYLVLGRGVVYYSLTTLTSTGYGDLLPIHPLARSLSSFEAVIGQLFPATLLARIVTLEMQTPRAEGV
jgi:hypothetical protein